MYYINICIIKLVSHFQPIELFVICTTCYVLNANKLNRKENWKISIM